MRSLHIDFDKVQYGALLRAVSWSSSLTVPYPAAASDLMFSSHVAGSGVFPFSFGLYHKAKKVYTVCPQVCLHRSSPATVRSFPILFRKYLVRDTFPSAEPFLPPLTSESPNHRRSDNCTGVSHQPILVALVSLRFELCTVCAVSIYIRPTCNHRNPLVMIMDKKR